MKTSDAVDRLAGVVELGHLHTMSGEAAPLLLAAADEIESLRAAVKRWRGLCPVTEDDPDLALVSWPQAREWLMTEATSDYHYPESFLTGLLDGKTEPADDDVRRSIVGIIAYSHMWTSLRTDREVLDAMAAIEC